MDGDRNVMTMASLKDWVLEAMSQHRFGEAEKTLRTALESPLQNTDLQFLLGTVLASSGKLDEAIHYLEEVRKALPNNVSVLNNLGNVLRLRGRVEEAVTHLRHALTVHSDSPDVLINLGLCLTTLGRGDQAVQCARLALRLRPQDPEAMFVLATALGETGRAEEAAQCFEQVLRARPGHPAALNGLAMARRDQGKLDDAISGLRSAIAGAPEDPTLHTNLGLCLMEQGELATGSAEYEWRLRRPGAARLNLPLWDGKPLAGRSLLLWADTGFADAILLIRFAPMLRPAAGRIVFACPAPLARLAATAPGIDQVVAHGEPLPPVHAYIPLTSLLNRLGITAQTIPASAAYLAADPARAGALVPAQAGGFKVGLIWNGGAKDRRRAMPLAALAPLLQIPGLRFYGLDHGGAQEIASGPFNGRIADISGKLADLADMAAAVSQLDLVVTVDSVAAHIAGAIGRPAWVMLPTSGDWRWPGDGTDSRWYPSLLLYRQTQTGAWDRVVEQIAGALAVFGNAVPADSAAQPMPPPLPAAFGASFITALRQYRSSGAVDQVIAGLALQPQSPDLLFRLGALMAEAGKANEAQDIMMRLRRLALDPSRVVNLGVAMAGDDLKIGLAWSGHDEALNALLDVPGVSFFALSPRPADDRIADLTPELTDFYRYAGALRQLDLVVTTDMGLAHLASALDRPAWLFLPSDTEASWIGLAAAAPCYALLRAFGPEQGGGEQSAVHRLVGEVARQALIGERSHRPETLNNLGVLLRRFGRLDDAVACYRRALEKRPDYPLALSNLGMALKEQGNLQEAIACLVKALELKPGYADGHNNLAVALDSAGLGDQAALHYRRALELKPDHIQALGNLGNNERIAGRLDEAIRLQRRALQIRPDNPEALTNLGASLRVAGDTDGAIEYFRRAIAQCGDYAGAHMGLAMALMAKGDVRAGSAEFEWRWRNWRGATMPALNAPLWDGQPLGDKTLLLWSEEGLADTIQFVRFAPLLRGLASRIVLACPPALVRLMGTVSGIDGVVAIGEAMPAFDAHLPLMSAMHRLGTTLATIPRDVPYLAVDPAGVAALAPLVATDTIKIGLSWGSDSEIGGRREPIDQARCPAPDSRHPRRQLLQPAARPGRRRAGPEPLRRPHCRSDAASGRRRRRGRRHRPP